MLLSRRLLLLISIFFCFSSSLSREEGQWTQINRTFISKEIFLDGEDPSLENHSGEQMIPTVIHEYPLPIHVKTKYQTEQNEYTFRESILFSLRTHQDIRQSVTLLAGYVTENIKYIFEIENNRLKVKFIQDNLPDLILITNKTFSKSINDGQWHQIRVNRLHRKVRCFLDGNDYAAGSLSDRWHARINLFVGAELTPVPHGDFTGALSDIKIFNHDRLVHLREDTTDDESLVDLPIAPVTIASPSLFSSLQTLSFLPKANDEISISPPLPSPFRSFSLTFRSLTQICTVVQFDAISLIIDADGYLALVIRPHQAQRIFAETKRQTVNDGHSHTIHLLLMKNKLQAWIDPMKKITVELDRAIFVVEQFRFGPYHQYIGCIEQVIYNDQMLTFTQVPFSRRECPQRSILTDQMISFEEFDPPVMMQLDFPEELQSFSFRFTTFESNSLLCTLTGQTYQDILTLNIRQQRLFLSYQRERLELITNQSLSLGREHHLMIKILNSNDFVFQVNEQIILQRISSPLIIQKVTFGSAVNHHGKHFLGCISQILYNGKSLLRWEHIQSIGRVTTTCHSTKSLRSNSNAYLASNISFSIRDVQDRLSLPLTHDPQFHQHAISLKTRHSFGVLSSLSSSKTDRSLILSLHHGRIQLHSHLSLIFDDDRMINDGQFHHISLERMVSGKVLHLRIDQRRRSLSFPDHHHHHSSFVFDHLIIAGSDRFHSNQTFVGCLANILYNDQPIIPRAMISSDRYDCSYQENSLCDRRQPCQKSSLCGEDDCSLVCHGQPFGDFSRKGSVHYHSQLALGQDEQISFLFHSSSTNGTLMVIPDGMIQISIVLQNGSPRLVIESTGMIDTYDFPGQIQLSRWHYLHLEKSLYSIDLTLDDQTRSYNNDFSDYFSFFRHGQIYLCGNGFIGYFQDILLHSDDLRENLIINSLSNPILLDYDSNVRWNSRAYLSRWTPCARIQCLNGGYCIQPATPTAIAYCHCPSQYTGYRCEQAAVVDPCVNYQCNHGTCHKDRNNQAYCSCYEGYGGPRCETQIDPCARVNCNHGRCELERSVAVCRCYAGFTGHDCLAPIDACARVSCNYGRCINEGISYRCECQRGYEGPACDRLIDPCASFVCYNGGRCIVHQNHQAVCQCVTGYRGTNCYEQEADPCLRYDCNGGTCTNDRGVARCVCPVGRIGSRCQDDICVLYPCANNGQCVPEGGSRRCICVNPYYGDDCREVYRPNPCDNVYCGYGQCQEGICECHSGYTGARCDIPPDLCANVNCYHGTCVEGHCSCMEQYTGTYCETPVTTPTPPALVGSPSRPSFTAQTVGYISPKTGQLIDYGRLLSPRAGPIGWILALVSGLLLLPLALAFAARKCTTGACVPPGARRGDYIPVQVEPVGGAANRNARDLQILDERGNNLAAAAAETETTRIEQTREIVREYGGMESAGMSAGFSSYPTMSSRYGDFARDQQQQQQQSSAAHSQQHVIETDYHVPPVADFGYNRSGVTEGYRDVFESWETTGAGGYSMNAMFADGGLQTDYELSNINSISMTPNGKYTIVGQSQGPPQIWDAINGQLVSSMQGTSINCTKVALACNGTLLVGLASDGIDPQSNVLQIWDVNTGKPVQLTHQIKCATFTLSNNSNNLIMAGNQKYGRGISVGVLDLANSELTKEIKSDTNQSYGGTPSYITLTPDERYAIVGCSTPNAPTTYVVFDLTTMQEAVQPGTIVLDADSRCSLVLNQEQIVTGTRNGQLIVWNIPTCQRLQSLNDNGQNAHRDRITDLKMSPERAFFVSTSADGTAKIWDCYSKELISRLIGHKREITCACISTNQLVATGSRDQTICLWRLQTGQVASTMPVGMTPLDIHMAAHNRTVVAIGDKDGERQLLMLRVVSVQR